MSFGVPVIVHKNVAASSPVIHGINGYIAESSEEFAHYCLILNEDRGKCRALGEAARKTVRESWSQGLFNERLAHVLSAGTKSEKRMVTFLPPAPQSASELSSNRWPMVSVIIHAPHSQSESQRTLQSLFGQDDPRIEVFLVGKFPATKALSHPSALCIRQMPSLAKALRQCTGQMICVLQAGDILMPHAMQTVAACLSAQPQVLMIEGRFSLLNEYGQPHWIADSPAHHAQPAHSAWLRRCALWFRRESIRYSKADTERPLAQWFEQLVEQSQTIGETVYTDALLGGIPTAACPDIPLRDASKQDKITVRERLLITPEAARRELQRHVQALECRDVLDHINRIKDTPSEKRPKKLKEFFFARMVQCQWQNFSHRNGRQARVALFGAGLHTHWLLSIVPHKRGPKVIAILDDFASSRCRIRGIPVVRAAEFDFHQVDAIIPSTDTSTGLFVNRCRALYGPRVPLWYLYKGLPAGPYPKIM